MAARGKRAASFRLAPRTLRVRLTLLYAAVFCGCAAVLGAAVVVFKPGFLVHSSFRAAHGAPHTVNRPWDGSLGSFLAGLTAHHNVGGGAALIAIAAVLAAGAGWLIAGRVVRPLRTITATARDISASNLSRRLEPGARGNELGDLGDTLNDLFGRLEASFESQRRFVANASHELRTPLSASRALLQVALADPDATVESLRAACQEVLTLGDQQERLIEALLTLAVSQRGLERSQPLDLADITREVLLARQHEAEDRGVQVSAALAAAPTAGDPRLAESLVANLVDNAIRHNQPSGRVEISTGCTEAGAVIAVGNTGPPIPPDEVGRLFEPFRQLGTQRVRHGEGYGLGLAIVRAIADAHGATVAARARPRGGLEVQVDFTAPPGGRPVPAGGRPEPASSEAS